MKQSAEKTDKARYLTIRITENEVNKAREKAEKSGLSLSQVVRKLLEDYVNDPQPKLIFG